MAVKAQAIGLMSYFLYCIKLFREMPVRFSLENIVDSYLNQLGTFFVVHFWMQE